MSIFLFLTAGLVAAFVMHFMMSHSGVGGLIGDIAMGLVGAGLGTYMITSYNMGHALDNYNLLVAIDAFGAAVFLLLLVHWLSRRMPEAPDADTDDAVMT